MTIRSIILTGNYFVCLEILTFEVWLLDGRAADSDNKSVGIVRKSEYSSFGSSECAE